MPASAKRKIAIYLLILGWLAPLPASAGPYAAVVKYADLDLQSEEYVLSAEILYRLSPKAIDALKNGVPLFWALNIKIMRQRDFWPDETIAEKSLRFRIQYQALLNVYRVRNEDSGEGGNFSSLASALDALSTIHSMPIAARTMLTPGLRYTAGIRVVFDRELLPLPLRPFAYLNSQWYLSSDWYLWHLNN
ncbi:DUF4390 domain-containing protein [Candidatus Methylomicrobium oryzae]|uniref:DUF4390 domain-containing protein n=1 Tax=Candidatus Methylomicrobium oryzae TaxID=2802053 RepID=UPI001925018F|nr:DUF4390 domain-containing protein [Methylomicrobium sp. RS1]MBL1262629.1 DUF4390 domain-containing protein [Methylomicrobium sp. RS1]